MGRLPGFSAPWNGWLFYYLTWLLNIGQILSSLSKYANVRFLEAYLISPADISEFPSPFTTATDSTGVSRAPIFS